MVALGKAGVAVGTEAGNKSTSSQSSSHYAHSRRFSAIGGNADSFYSEVTGLPPSGAHRRQPVIFAASNALGAVFRLDD
jgi:hypothetical protein